MLGHQLLRQWLERHDTRVTLRRERKSYAGQPLFSADNAYYEIDAARFDDLTNAVSDFGPEAVVNAIGIVKQQAASKESIPSIEVNSLLPHRLAVLCKSVGARLIHMSTDCVFSGRKGSYREDDVSDAEDLYGKTKFLGEIHESHCITLRTSIIGTELYRKKSLLEWFLAQKDSVKGYTKAIFSGLTTLEMSRVIEMILTRGPEVGGLYHVSSAPISKFDLLTMLKRKMGIPIEIRPDDSIRIDRSLDSSRFRAAFGYTPPTWEQMSDELVTEIKRSHK